MLKRIVALLLSAVLVFGLAGLTLAASGPASDTQTQTQDGASVPQTGEEAQTPPAAQEEEAPASPSAPEEADESLPGESETEDIPEPEVACNFYLNDLPVPGMPLKEIDGAPYCGLRTFFNHALQSAEVSWVNSQAEVRGETAGGEALTLVARPGACYVTANGRCLYVENGVRLEDGVTMVSLDVLARIFTDSEVGYDEESGTARVSLGERLLTCGEEFYNAEELELISRVIDREAGYEPLEGKIALANLIMNRVASSIFPDTVRDVLYQQNQFTVVKSGKFWTCTPGEETVLAAKLAMDGASVLPTALFYNRAGMNSWAARHRPYVATIGHHAFYA